MNQKQLQELTDYAKSPDSDPRKLFAMLRENPSAIQSMFFGSQSQQNQHGPDTDAISRTVVQSIRQMIQAQMINLKCVSK